MLAPVLHPDSSFLDPVSRIVLRTLWKPCNLLPQPILPKLCCIACLTHAKRRFGKSISLDHSRFDLPDGASEL